MQNYVISCCSTVDVPAEFFARRNVEYVCFKYILDGVEYPDDFGVTVPFDKFYASIEAGAMPTTSQINAAEFIDYFSKMLEQGKDIIHITLSSGLSGTYTSACMAAEDLAEKYPDRKITVIDSLGASAGSGLLTEYACDLRDSGASYEEVVSWLENNKLNLHHWFFSTDLTSYYRGGRISKTSAIIGSAVHLCPLLNMNTEGKLIVRSKCIGKKKAIRDIVERMIQHAKDGKEYSGKCFISNSACYEDARAVADLVEKNFPNLNGKVEISSIGTVIGSHTGPGTVALFFLGDDRTI